MNKFLKLKSISIFIYYFIFVSTIFFFPPFLKEIKGISNNKIIYLAVIGNILLIGSFILSGYLSDKYKSTKTIIIGNIIISILLFLTLILSFNKSVVSIVYVLTFPTFIMLTSLMDGMILNNLDQKKYNYVRAFGSLGGAISYFINSFALNYLSYEKLILIQIALLVSLIILIIFIKTSYKYNSSNYSKALKGTLKNRSLLIIFVLSFLTYGVLTADDTFNYAYNVDVVKIPPIIFGIVGFVSIMLEATLMFYFSRFRNKFSNKKLLFSSSFILLMIYLTKFLFVSSPLIISIGNIMLGVFIAIFIPTSINIITSNVQKENLNTFLGFYQLCTKLGAIIIGLVTAIFLNKVQSFEQVYILHFVILLFTSIFILILNENKF